MQWMGFARPIIPMSTIVKETSTVHFKLPTRSINDSFYTNVPMDEGFHFWKAFLKFFFLDKVNPGTSKRNVMQILIGLIRLHI